MRPLIDEDVTAATEWLQIAGLPGASRDTVFAAVELAARESSSHPVRDYLDALSATKLSAQFPACDSSEAIPEIAPADAQGDREWFADHPERRFRARSCDGGVWLIRRWPQGGGSDVYLRVFSRALEMPQDSDAGIAISWYRAAWPDKPSDEVRKAAAKALKGAAP